MTAKAYSLGALSGLVLLAVAASPAQADGKLEYNRDIRPILAENCFACHGPDSAARKAGLRIDRREDAIAAGAITAGQPEKSLLVERIFSTEPRQQMPPPKSLKHLTPAQKEILRRWVAEGAEYQPHWSFIAAKRPALPPVKNEKWVRNPLDRFILAELEKHGLSPAPEADRRTLARRASLDLTGLPPDPAEVEAFVNDKAPDAYERYVDSLLRSPHWGEHRGRHWLDVARYADTHGIHFDNFREMWSYRDWVINAFNRNLPFDQFTIEQLAGDLLPGATLEQKIASGFNRCNITTNEGGAIAEEYLVLYNRDRTETTSQVWMGLTAGCAVCHEHKFDPLSQREFYEMAAFFNNTTQAAMDGNIKDTPPILVVPRAEDRARWDALRKELTAAQQQIDARKQAARAAFDKWLTAARAGELFGTLPGEGLKLHALLADGGQAVTVTVDGQQRPVPLDPAPTWQPGHVAGQALTVKANGFIPVDGAGDFDSNQGFSYGAWVRLAGTGQNGAIVAHMDALGSRGWDLWLENGRIGAHLLHKGVGDGIKVLTANQVRVKPNEWHHVFITYDGSRKAAGLHIYLDGAVQDARQVQADKLTGTIQTPAALTLGGRPGAPQLDNVAVQDVRVYSRDLAASEVEKLARVTRAAWLVARPSRQRTPAETNELFDWYLPAMDQVYQQLTAKLAGLTAEEAALKARGTIAHVMQEKPQEAMAFVLHRGEYDHRRDQVKAGTPAFLPPYPADLPRNRIGYAQWLLLPDHPLTARVTVNRFWQEVFGTGLVRTSGDFGVAGEQPSHPELLDWLAVDFREAGWDIKAFFKQLVTSATYRQAAITTPEKREKDPHNRLLSRGPRFRMDAEMIRDHALAASGLLVRKLGGPSVRPYQPEGVWEAVAMIGSNTRNYQQDKGESLYRRSMYTLWKRAAPPASMDILNAPSREVCTVRRERTNTPLQALVTLNDPQFVEAARNLAQKAILETGGRDEDRINYIARHLIARPFRPEEMQVVQDTLGELLAYYKAQPDDGRKLIAVGETKADPGVDASLLAAWTMVVNELMNLDEVLNK